MKEDTYIKFYEEAKSLYLESDASAVVFGTGWLQIRDEMNCP